VHREWNKRLTADQAQKMYEQAMKLEQEFGEYFTGTVANYNKYLFTGNIMSSHCRIRDKARNEDALIQTVSAVT